MKIIVIKVKMIYLMIFFAPIFKPVFSMEEAFSTESSSDEGFADYTPKDSLIMSSRMSATKREYQGKCLKPLEFSLFKRYALLAPGQQWQRDGWEVSPNWLQQYLLKPFSMNSLNEKLTFFKTLSMSQCLLFWSDYKNIDIQDAQIDAMLHYYYLYHVDQGGSLNNDERITDTNGVMYIKDSVSSEPNRVVFAKYDGKSLAKEMQRSAKTLQQAYHETVLTDSDTLDLSLKNITSVADIELKNDTIKHLILDYNRLSFPYLAKLRTFFPNLKTISFKGCLFSLLSKTEEQSALLDDLKYIKHDDSGHGALLFFLSDDCHPQMKDAVQVAACPSWIELAKRYGWKAGVLSLYAAAFYILYTRIIKKTAASLVEKLLMYKETVYAGVYAYPSVTIRLIYTNQGVFIHPTWNMSLPLHQVALKQMSYMLAALSVFSGGQLLFNGMQIARMIYPFAVAMHQRLYDPSWILLPKVVIE